MAQSLRTYRRSLVASVIAAAVALVGLLAGGLPATSVSGQSLPAIVFDTAAGDRVPLRVEVADEGREQGCGLMHRRSMPEGQGMIFVWASDREGASFYMRNTLIPLSIAFIAADGTIVGIYEMEPVPEPGYTPLRLTDGSVVFHANDAPVPNGALYVTYGPDARVSWRYAIEANAGWYARHGIGVGDRVDVWEALVLANAAAPPPVGPC